MLSPGVHDASSYGPVHITLACALPSFFPAAAENFASWMAPAKLAISVRNRASGDLNVSVTCNGPVARIEETLPNRKLVIVVGAAACLRLQTTSAAVSGLPSQKRTPDLTSNTSVRSSGRWKVARLGATDRSGLSR